MLKVNIVGILLLSVTALTMFQTPHLKTNTIVDLVYCSNKGNVTWESKSWA